VGTSQDVPRRRLPSGGGALIHIIIGLWLPVEEMLQTGAFTAYSAFTVLIRIIAALGVSVATYSWTNTRWLWGRLITLLYASVCILACVMASAVAVTEVRHGKVAEREHQSSRVDDVTRVLEAAEAELKKLGDFPWTTQKTLDAADRAAKDAARLGDEEGSARLGGKRSKYEQRRVEAQEAQELALQAASNKDKTDRSQELQRKIEDLKARKEHMDPTPKEADQEAAFWAKLLGLRDDPATKAVVSEWISYAWAILGELILLGMTANLRKACGLYQPPPKQLWLSRLLAYIPRRLEPPETSPPPRQSKQNEAAAVRAEPVLEAPPRQRRAPPRRQRQVKRRRRVVRKRRITSKAPLKSQWERRRSATLANGYKPAPALRPVRSSSCRQPTSIMRARLWNRGSCSYRFASSAPRCVSSDGCRSRRTKRGATTPI
jgi:hypothetical protein